MVYSKRRLPCGRGRRVRHLPLPLEKTHGLSRTAGVARRSLGDSGAHCRTDSQSGFQRAGCLPVKPEASSATVISREPNVAKRFLKILGPASSPALRTTILRALGHTLSPAPLRGSQRSGWLALVTFPLMAAVQFSAKIGMVSGMGQAVASVGNSAPEGSGVIDGRGGRSAPFRPLLWQCWALEQPPPTRTIRFAGEPIWKRPADRRVK
jgi:hypothetical protein